jgi:hypothetical protein
MKKKTLNLTLKIWRQKDESSRGKFVTYPMKDVSTDMSFLEMLDVLNESLIQKGEDPVAFDHDCREGICGMCSLMINGQAHGPDRETTTCQLHMRRFKDGQKIVIEPWRAKSFPVIKDLTVDRSAFDRIMVAGGYTSTNVGNAQDGNCVLVSKESVAGPASPPAKTPRPCSLPPPKWLIWPSCPRASPNAGVAPRRWLRKWTPRASVPAPILTSARPPAPRGSR